MNGVFVVDKPRGITSFDVVARVRRALGERRVGHTGTLDPMATGVLPMCVGEATKLVPFLMDREKVYQAEARLGVTTDTLDADGQVLAETDAAHLTRDQIAAALAGLVGRQLQVPPMHSALRVGGRRLYELARAGETVEREPREIDVQALDFDALIADAGDLRVRFTVRCGKGTYVRVLAADLGTRLGVGAHLTALRRTRVGRFTVEEAVGIEALAGAALLPPAEALDDLPALTLDADQARQVRDGKVRAIAELPAPPGDCVRLLRADGSLLAVARRQGEPVSLRLARVFG